MNTFAQITPLQERDSCLALILLILIFWLFYRTPWLVYAAMAALLLGMVWPPSMRPFAWCWFGLSRILSKFMGAILLGLIWCCLVIPVGAARRAMGKDSLKLKQWHNGSGSAFVDRNHTYTSADISAPY